MKMAEIIQEIDEKKSEIDAANKAHKALIDGINQEIKDLSERLNCAVSGIDFDLIRKGKSVIQVSGLAKKSEQRKDMVRLAISDLAAGCPHMIKEYFGIKIYSGFGEQRSDHPYGYGPRHGSTVFSIGLASRGKIKLPDDLETEAAIYYLMNIDAVQKAESSAKAGAV